MSAELEKLLVNTVVNSSTMHSLIKDRFYPANMFAVRQLTFPCINYRIGGGDIDPHAMRYFRVSLEFWIVSRQNYSQCWSIFESLYDLLNKQALKSTALAAQINISRYPEEFYEETIPAFMLAITGEAHVIRL
jgi:hypothetical protein